MLSDEANSFKRWKEEFKALFKKNRIVMLYGSTIKNYEQARDIDIMIVIKKRDIDEVRKIISEKQAILPKKVHSIELTENDIIKNIRERKEAMIDIVKNAIILHGQDKYVDIIKNVTSS